MDNNSFNKYVLWAQASNTSSNAMVVVDGENVTSNDSLYMRFSQEAIHISSGFKEIYSRNGTTIYKTNVSESIIMIMSHFSDVDIVGRRIAYSCKVKATSIQEAMIFIKNEMLKYGYNVELIDFPPKRTFLSKLSKKQKITLLFASIIAIVSIAIIVAVVKNILICSPQVRTQ